MVARAEEVTATDRVTEETEDATVMTAEVLEEIGASEEAAAEEAATAEVP